MSIPAILFWGVTIASSSFSEPTQVALVGHYAFWRSAGPQRKIITIGTKRKSNDIVLHDRKASPEHLLLERKGTGKHWWALLHNLSKDRKIVLRKKESPQRRTTINQYRLRDGDTFQLPLRIKDDGSGNSDLQNIDWCSPAQVLQLLRNANSTSSKDPKLQVQYKTHRIPFVVEEFRFPVQLWNMRARVTKQENGQLRTIWLNEHQRIKLPKAAGGGLLEYRHLRWQRYKNKTWTPLKGAIGWGKGKYKIEVVRKPKFSATPRYHLGQARTPCRFPLRPKAIAGGLEIAGIARLFFQSNRLFLQHLGQGAPPLQIVPKARPPRQLGTVRLDSGDILSIGQLTYRVHIDKKGVRLMIVRSPSGRMLLPMFSSNRSEHFTMRRNMLYGRKLLLTGGEGGDPRADRWKMNVSLAGELEKSQVRGPYRPFLLISPTKDARYMVSPLEGTALYQAQPDGKLLAKPIAKAMVTEPGKKLFYAKRMYLRIFRPSYRPLALSIAFLWVTVAGGMVFLLFWLMSTGRLRLSPIPATEWLQALPANDKRRHLLNRFQEPNASWFQRLLLFGYWLPSLALLPVALFLNGLGLYVLATLSLSSLGLNNNSYLYRQLLWSLVGVCVFLGFICLPSDWWQRLKTRFTKPKPQGVYVPQPLQKPFYLRLTFQIFTGVYFVAALATNVAFQNWKLLLPAVLLYAAICFLLWEMEKTSPHSLQSKNLRFFFITLLLLGFVPLIGVLIPPLVHNRFFLKLPGLGTVKLSDFAIVSAIIFFANYLGEELFAIRSVQATKAAANPMGTPSIREVSVKRERIERLGRALYVTLLYLFLLGAIGVLYTIQGDLGPGLILTLCFTLYLLFAFAGPGVDRLTTAGNWLRIAVVFGGLLMIWWLPDFVATLFPDWAQQSAELQKVRERLSLWNQPWRFMVGEQLLQNQWALAGFQDSFQWFNNLHSDFVLTAVVRVLSPSWGIVVILLTCSIPLMTLGAVWMRWLPILRADTKEQLAVKQQMTIRALIILFGGIYLFAQNFIHIGSTLRLTPMTGVTLTWISSGGTSLIACYIVLALIYRQMKNDV